MVGFCLWVVSWFVSDPVLRWFLGCRLSLGFLCAYGPMVDSMYLDRTESALVGFWLHLNLCFSCCLVGFENLLKHDK